MPEDLTVLRTLTSAPVKATQNTAYYNSSGSMWVFQFGSYVKTRPASGTVRAYCEECYNTKSMTRGNTTVETTVNYGQNTYPLKETSYFSGNLAEDWINAGSQSFGNKYCSVCKKSTGWLNDEGYIVYKNPGDNSLTNLQQRN